METLSYLAISALAVLLGLFQFLAHRERSEMLDRLMAKSLPEYKDNQAPEPNEIAQTDEEVVPLEDAEEELNDYGQDEDR